MNEGMHYMTEWYKPICVKCPYFVNIETGIEVMRCMSYSADKTKAAPKDLMPVVKCERPTDSACLGDNVFVQRLVAVENIKRMVQLKRAAAKMSDDIEHELLVDSRPKRNAQLNMPYKRGKIKRRKIKSRN